PKGSHQLPASRIMCVPVRHGTRACPTASELALRLELATRTPRLQIRHPRQVGEQMTGPLGCAADWVWRWRRARDPAGPTRVPVSLRSSVSKKPEACVASDGP